MEQRTSLPPRYARPFDQALVPETDASVMPAVADIMICFCVMYGHPIPREAAEFVVNRAKNDDFKERINATINEWNSHFMHHEITAAGLSQIGAILSPKMRYRLMVSFGEIGQIDQRTRTLDGEVIAMSMALSANSNGGEQH